MIELAARLVKTQTQLHVHTRTPRWPWGGARWKVNVAKIQIRWGRRHLCWNGSDVARQTHAFFCKAKRIIQSINVPSLIRILTLSLPLTTTANKTWSVSNALWVMLSRANPTKWIFNLGGFFVKKSLAAITKHFSSKANVAFWTILLFFPHPITRWKS